MRISTISINNLKIRKGKALFVLIGLSLAVATVVGVISIATAIRIDLDRKLDEVGANILISPKTEGLTLNYGGIVIPGVSYEMKELTVGDVAKIRTIKNKKNINIVSPKLVGSAEVEGKKAVLVGVLFDQEVKLKKWWEIKGNAPKREEEVLLGSEVAKKFGKRVGDTVSISENSYIVSGILKEAGSQDDGVIFLDLKEVQDMLKKPGKVSLVEVAAWCFDCPIEEIVRQLKGKLPQAKISALKQVVTSKMTTLEIYERFAFILSFLLLLIGSLIVLITMMSSVAERTKEIGVFRAIGFRQSHIMKIILLEAFILSLTSGLVGYLFGMGGVLLLAPRLANIEAPLLLSPKLLLLALLISVFVGLASSIYPARRASQLEPTEALRYI